MGKALYRKYRPLALKDVIGQEAVVKSLTTALKQGKISHAYLFTGPRGCGKTSVARIFAHEINGFKYELEDSYVDIIEIDAASNTGVDNIRELREKAIIAPTMGKYKVYIIDEVHMLSKSAFNALLKIMEEPPQHVVFIMATTNPEKVPITITSRALVYSFTLAPANIMQSHLKSIAKQEKISITDEALAIITKRGGGSFRDSISLLDQLSTLSTNKITAEMVEHALGLPQAELIKNLLDSFASGDANAITSSLQTALNAGVKEEALVDELLQQIIANPLPEYLPLLAKLPSVTAPFITAKLLTAFLGEGKSTVTTTSATRPSVAVQSVITTQPVPENTQPNPISATQFSWPNFLQKAEQNTTRGIFSNLKKCRHAIINGQLHLYPDNFGQRILSSPANKALILKQLGDIQLIIHQADETPPISTSLTPTTKEASSPLNQIFGIINETQEDNYAGEVPF